MNRIRPALSLLLLCVAFDAAAHPLDHWHQRYLTPNGIYDIKLGNGLLVAVGTNGLVVTSADGTNWTTQLSVTSQPLRRVTFGDGRFVTVGDSGTILSSLNGTNWSPHVSGTTTNLLAVQYGNGVFVASGANVVLTSPDGMAWTLRYPTNGYFSQLTYGNGLFVTARPSWRMNLVSTDGTVWFPRTNGTSVGLYTLGFANGQFLAIDVNLRVLTSLDAGAWTVRGSATLGRRTEVAYGNGHFVAAGAATAEYSRDLARWTRSAATNLSFLSGATFANGYFYVLEAPTSIWQSDPVVQLQSTAVDTLSIAGPTNQTYQIESNEDFADFAAWQIVTNITLSSSPQSWTDPRPPVRQRLYRAALSP
jgi:hypothetical protein